MPAWLNRPPHRLEEVDQLLLPEGTSPDVPGSPVMPPLRRVISGFAGLIAMDMMTRDEADELLGNVLAVLERHRPNDRRGEA